MRHVMRLSSGSRSRFAMRCGARLPWLPAASWGTSNAVTRRWCSTITAAAADAAPGDAEAGLVVGNTTRGIRSNLATAYERSEFIGHLFPLIRPRADAGDVLALIDTCAGRGAGYHMNNRVCEGHFVVRGALSMATVSFNSFMFTQPVYEGDLIKLETRVVNVGDSSIGMYVRVKRQAHDSPTPSIVGESYVTMVVVHAAEVTKVASGHVPAVRLVEAVDVERRTEYLTLRRLAKELANTAATTPPSAAEVEHPENRSKQRKLKPDACRCRIDRSFGVGDMNANKAIFGGEVLRFMEKCALHCGRVFAGDAHLFTLGMMDMTFDGPLFLHDLARCTAQVTCVRRSTLIVNVDVVAVDADGKTRSTNRASFLIVAVDPHGVPSEIATGIDLEGASREELTRYWQGRRYMEEAARRRRGSGKMHAPTPASAPERAPA